MPVLTRQVRQFPVAEYPFAEEELQLIPLRRCTHKLCDSCGISAEEYSEVKCSACGYFYNNQIVFSPIVYAIDVGTELDAEMSKLEMLDDKVFDGEVLVLDGEVCICDDCRPDDDDWWPNYEEEYEETESVEDYWMGYDDDVDSVS